MQSKYKKIKAVADCETVIKYTEKAIKELSKYANINKYISSKMYLQHKIKKIILSSHKGKCLKTMRQSIMMDMMSIHRSAKSEMSEGTITLHVLEGISEENLNRIEALSQTINDYNDFKTTINIQKHENMLFCSLLSIEKTHMVYQTYSSLEYTKKFIHKKIDKNIWDEYSKI